MAERIIRSDEKPALSALLDDRLAGAVGERVGVVRIVHGIGRAVFVRQAGASGGGIDIDAFLFSGNFGHRDRNAGSRNVDDHVDTLCVVPLARLVRAHVGFVLVVGKHDLDRLAQHLAAEVLDCHARRLDRARSGEIGVQTGHVVHDADFHPVARERARFGRGRFRRLSQSKIRDHAEQCRTHQCRKQCAFHVYPFH
jgi:hypothetical protein